MRKRRWARERQKRADRVPILKKLQAALLRSFRGWQGKNMVCARGVPGVTGAPGKTNSISTQSKRNRHFVAIVDWCSPKNIVVNIYLTWV